MPTPDPLWKTPTLPQKLSDRTVFRFQQIANLLRQDLNPLPGFRDELRSVLFVQRDWKHTKTKDEGRFYNANFCSTYRLDSAELAAVRQELKNAHSNADASQVTENELTALFTSYDDITGQNGSHTQFSQALAGDHFDKVHAVLAEAASAVPYKGELPTAFDGKLTEAPAGIWFTNNTDTWRCKTMPQLALSGAEESLDVLPLSLHTDVKGENHDALISILKKFLNPLLLGEPPATAPPSYPTGDPRLHGLAFPCYEETKQDAFSGAFLGWLILIFSNPIAPSLTASWDAFRFAMNNFADRILEATIDEILGEYNPSRWTPEEAFEYYLKRVEGWHVDGTTGEELSLPRGEGRSDFKKSITPKWDTKAAGGLSDSLLMRCHRLYRGLTFVFENSRVEAMKKYEQMLTLLGGPLRNLTSALSEMQRDTQELRAILYDPAHAIFESAQLLSDLFAERRHIQVSPFVRVMISHNCDYSEEDEHAEGSRLDGRVVWAVALCRIFGVQNRLAECRTKHSVVLAARGLVQEVGGQDAFEQLTDDLLYLCDPTGKQRPVHLSDSLKDDTNVSPCLERLKMVVFKPFKLDESKWHMLALLLALERYRHTDRNSMPSALTLPVEFSTPPKPLADVLINPVTVPGMWTPVAYHVVLNFLLKAVAVAHKKGKQISVVKIHLPPAQPSVADSFVIEVCFSGSYVEGATEAAKHCIDGLWQLINERVLTSPRDWRLEATNVGDFRTPFVEFASRVLGFVDSDSTDEGDKGWTKEKTQPDFDAGKPNPVCILYRGKREFRLELGHQEAGCGIRLCWCPRTESAPNTGGKVQIALVKGTPIEIRPKQAEVVQPANGVEIHIFDHETPKWSEVIRKRLSPWDWADAIKSTDDSHYPGDENAAKLSSGKCLVIVHSTIGEQRVAWAKAFSDSNGRGHILFVSGGARGRSPDGSSDRVHACDFNLLWPDRDSHFSRNARVAEFFEKLCQIGDADLSSLPWNLLKRNRQTLPIL